MTKQQAKAALDRLVQEKYGGDYEAYRADLAKRGAKGGKKSKGGGFAYGELGRRRASVAGRKSANARKRKDD
jgi:hypothetical protein